MQTDKMLRGYVRQLQRQRLWLSYQDSYADAQLGLLEALARFRPERGVKFATFAQYRIRGAMLDGQRKASWYHRGVGFIETRSLRKSHEQQEEGNIEARVDVVMLLEKLPEREAMVLALCYLAGWPRIEVAKLLGISKSWVCRLEQRALLHCRANAGQVKAA